MYGKWQITCKVELKVRGLLTYRAHNLSIYQACSIRNFIFFVPIFLPFSILRSRLFFFFFCVPHFFPPPLFRHARLGTGRGRGRKTSGGILRRMSRIVKVNRARERVGGTGPGRSRPGASEGPDAGDAASPVSRGGRNRRPGRPDRPTPIAVDGAGATG